MKSMLIKSSVLSFIVYPFLVVFAALFTIFQNKSFMFYGFNIIVHLSERSAGLELQMNPKFLTTFLVVFPIAFMILYFVSVIKNKQKTF